MVKRTFKFTGTKDAKEVQFFDPENRENVVVKKGETFSTEHPRLIEELESLEYMEETKASEERAEEAAKSEKATSAPKDGRRS